MVAFEAISPRMNPRTARPACSGESVLFRALSAAVMVVLSSGELAGTIINPTPGSVKPAFSNNSRIVGIGITARLNAAGGKSTQPLDAGPAVNWIEASSVRFAIGAGNVVPSN